MQFHRVLTLVHPHIWFLLESEVGFQIVASMMALSANQIKVIEILYLANQSANLQYQLKTLLS